MPRRWLGLGLVLFDTLGTSAAQVCFRQGASGLEHFGIDSLAEPWILAGLLIQIAMLPVLLYAYRFGDVVVFFPLLSLSHVWNSFAGAVWLAEGLTPARVPGTALIIGGCGVLAWPTRGRAAR